MICACVDDEKLLLSRQEEHGHEGDVWAGGHQEHEPGNNDYQRCDGRRPTPRLLAGCPERPWQVPWHQAHLHHEGTPSHALPCTASPAVMVRHSGRASRVLNHLQCPQPPVSVLREFAGFRLPPLSSCSTAAGSLLVDDVKDRAPDCLGDICHWIPEDEMTQLCHITCPYGLGFAIPSQQPCLPIQFPACISQADSSGFTFKDSFMC